MNHEGIFDFIREQQCMFVYVLCIFSSYIRNIPMLEDVLKAAMCAQVGETVTVTKITFLFHFSYLLSG